mmetsp:Transcript_28416/g.43022  ORF Transcript_28416/g.43022 Transcript_28416/m.43022 type:complete len:121 (-) Transcript_28416:52-414(-)
MRFTKQGVRICKVPMVNTKRAKSNEVSFRIRNNRGNLSSQSHRPVRLISEPEAPYIAKRKNGVQDFQKRYEQEEKRMTGKLTLLNPSVASHFGKHIPTEYSVHSSKKKQSFSTFNRKSGV